jgi:hypothetical protein
MVLLALAPCLIVLGIALTPVLLWVAVRDRWQARRVRLRFAGQTYLVWSSRHNWHSFVVNNVLPTLPNRIRPYCWRSVVKMPDAERQLRMVLGTWSHARPYLARIERAGVTIQPLNYALLPFRRYGRRNLDVQEVVAKVIRHADREC